MRIFVSLLAVLALAMGTQACGLRGRLKTPTQMEHDAQKKAAKEAKKQEKAEAEKAKQGTTDEGSPEPAAPEDE